jgi:hypothetical protein
MSALLKWILGSGLLGAGSLASLLAVAGIGSGSSGTSGGNYSGVPELSLGSAGLAVVLLSGTALLLAEKRRKAVQA